jgi:hypothetical protein
MRFIFIFTIIGFLLGCSDKPTQGKEFQNLTITEILPFFPKSSFSSNEIAGYTNQTGDVKHLNISMSETLENKTLGDNSYNAENLTVTLTDPTNSAYYISTSVGSNYVAAEVVTTYISASLLTEINGGLVPSVGLVLENGDLISHTKHEEIELNGKLFYNVHESIDLSSQIDGYNSLYFNSEVGIVAFTDGDGILWTFEEFKK